MLLFFSPSQILQTVKAPGQRQAAGIEVSCQFLVIVLHNLETKNLFISFLELQVCCACL